MVPRGCLYQKAASTPSAASMSAAAYPSGHTSPVQSVSDLTWIGSWNQRRSTMLSLRSLLMKRILLTSSTPVFSNGASLIKLLRSPWSGT